MKDSKKAPKKKSKITFGYVFSLIVFMFVGGICGIIGVEYIDTHVEKFDFSQLLFTCLIIIVFVYLAVFLQMIIHESGHLFFGLKTGYKFVSFRIGSFIFIKTADGIKLKRYSLAGTGGQCLLAPPPIIDGKFPYMLYNLGGSLFNLIFSLLAVIIYIFVKSPILLIFAAVGFAIAIINGIPMKMGEVNNDGHNALSLGKNKTALKSLYMQLLINAEVAKGMRLKDMPDSWFVMPDIDDMSDSLTAGYAAFVVSREIDEGAYDKACDDIEDIVENASGLVGVHRNGLIAERLFFELIGENNQEKIEELYTKDVAKALKASSLSPSAMRVLYAYETIHTKDLKKAEKYKKAFEKSIVSYPNAGEIEGEKELFALIGQKNCD